MKRVLIVVDMQNDFVTGVLGSKYAQDIVPNVVKKVAKYVNDGNRVIFTKDLHDVGYIYTREGKHLPIEHCIEGTFGSEIIDSLKEFSFFIVEKSSFGANWFNLANSDYKEDMKSWCYLFGADELEIIGVATNLCVISNAIELQNVFKDSEITIDASCCASYDPILHEKSLDVMEGLQFNVINR